MTYYTNISDVSYVLTSLYKNKLYFQKLVLLTVVKIITALILFTLFTLHNVLKVTLLTIQHCNYSIVRNTTESREVERLIKPAYYIKSKNGLRICVARYNFYLTMLIVEW